MIWFAIESLEHKIIKWIVAVVVFYAIFILIWKRFWDTTDEPRKPPIRRKHNDDDDDW